MYFINACYSSKLFMGHSIVYMAGVLNKQITLCAAWPLYYLLVVLFTTLPSWAMVHKMAAHQVEKKALILKYYEPYNTHSIS